MEPQKDPVAVVAIDFGTARSGYAFSFINPVNIINNQFELSEIPEKVSTCLLLNNHNNKLVFRAFGNEADGKLHILDKEANILAFRHFKMNLFDERTTVVAQNGVHVPIADVIAFSLKFLAHSAINHLNECSNGRNATMAQIQWVITVPAIWNDAAKHVMRTAAQQVGLPSSLILALEPEAAALCCRQNRKELKFEPGTTYMVVDSGGGTVDIAVHEIDEQGFTHSKCSPVGGAWGSTKIDDNFKQLLFDIFGPEILDDPYDFAEVLAAFEKEKGTFTPNKKYVHIPVYNFFPKNLAEVNKRFPITPITFERNKLQLPPTVMCSFFSDPINSIVSCVKTLIARLACTIDYIFLVGGFSRSIILKESIIQEFQSESTKIVLPNNPGMAIAEGAVYFGLNPKVIASRHSSYTYGIKVVGKFQEGVHPLHKKKKIDDEWYCSDLFLSLVTVNQKVMLNHQATTFAGRVSKVTDSVRIPLYCTKEEKVSYITPEMRLLGELVLEVPLDEELGTMNIKITMVFGGTEIAVQAEHTITKKAVSCHVEFVYTSRSEISALPLEKP